MKFSANGFGTWGTLKIPCMLHDHVIDEPYILHFGQHPTTMFFVSVGLVVGPRYEDHCLIGSNQTLLNNIM